MAYAFVVCVCVRVKSNNEELFFNAFLFENSYYLVLDNMWCVARVTCLVLIKVVI